MLCQKWYLLILKLLEILIIATSASLSKTVLYQAPDECRWSGYMDNDITLICHLRTINSELENTNFSVIQPQNTIRLRLECNNSLFIQSNLSPNSFNALNELKSLTIEYCKLGNITDGAFNGLENLQNFTLKTHNIDWSIMNLELDKNIFNKFHKLERLDLSLNSIWNINDGFLCTLKYINYLNISYNNLQDLDNFHFNNINNKNKFNNCGLTLITLDLSYNKILNLKSDILSNLKNLKYLYLNNNDMNYIADRGFENLLSLIVINLSENKLNNLPPELFKQSKYIKEIYLNNNSLNVLAPGLFSDLNELLKLDLSKNDLNSQWINSGTFIGLKKLIYLDLSYNKINKLELNIFKNLKNLQILKLQNNYIDYIPINIFIDLINLHTLVLSNNYIKNIELNTLNGLNNLIVLSLDYNHIINIDNNAFKNFTILQDLHLNGNKFNKIPDVLKNISILKTLDLGENLIMNIDNTSLISMENLFGLRLTENSIYNIKRGLFDRMIQLQILNLSRNKIKYIEPGSFHKNINLQAIRLDGNYIKTINGLFNDLNNLVWLNISDNNLETFDYSLIPKKLQWLDIHSNYITKLDNFFEIQSDLSLTTFDVSSNNLTDISSNIIPDSVEMLFLNNNLINNIQPYTFFKKPNLTRVDLFGNNISTLEPNAFRLSPIPDNKLIPSFYIGDNPFKCDCNLDWLQKLNINSRTQPNIIDINNINCNLLYKRGNNNLSLINIKSSDFLCKYESHCFALCHCCDFYACDCKMECPNSCLCYHDQSWISNVVDCSNSGYKNKFPNNIPMDSTQLYLDGNEFLLLESHLFIGRKKLLMLYLNNSNIQLIQNRTFYGLNNLELLKLDNNNIEKFDGNEFYGLYKLNELYLQHNKLKYINNETFINLKNLKILYLDHNLLLEIEFNTLPINLNELKLQSNPWLCDCKFIQKFRHFINNNNNIIYDKYKLKCGYNDDYLIYNEQQQNHQHQQQQITQQQQQQYQTNLLCNDIENINNIINSNLTSKKTILSSQQITDYIPFLISLLSCLLFIIIFTLLIFIFRQEMRIWFHSHFGIRLFYNQKNYDKNEHDKLYDAYISYSSKDEVFIIDNLIKILENGNPKYKLFLHYRDIQIGSYITDTIINAIESSKRTIMILSENYIKTEWCRYEFKTAHHQVLRDRRKRLIVILLGNIQIKDLDPDIRLYLKTNTYLQWGDKLFWDKLKFALPDIINKQNNNNTCIRYTTTQLQNCNLRNQHNINNRININNNRTIRNTNQIQLVHQQLSHCRNLVSTTSITTPTTAITTTSPTATSPIAGGITTTTSPRTLAIHI